MPDNSPDYIQFLIPKYQKQAFKNACFQRDTTMSREFRRFIFEFCKDTEEPRNDIYERLLRPYQMKDK